jgi:hypothetical protein
VHRLRTLVWRIRGLFHKGRLDLTMDEELRFHLEMETDRLVRNGMTAEAAVPIGGY